jgi:hypothetical protein
VFNDKPPCNIISSLVDVGVDGLLLSADVGANLEGLNLVVRWIFVVNPVRLKAVLGKVSSLAAHVQLRFDRHAPLEPLALVSRLVLLNQGPKTLHGDVWLECILVLVLLKVLFVSVLVPLWTIPARIQVQVVPLG